MKLSFARIAGRTVFASLTLSVATLPCFSQAQDTTPTQPQGKVIYSRSTDENGQTTTTNGPAASTGGQPANAPVATDVERQALRFTGLDLDVHLRPAEQYIAVRALLTVRNDGKSPLAQIPLQLSSSLAWDRIRLSGRDVPFQVATLNSDADHTGQLHEATITLDSPIAPNATAQLDVNYSGKIEANAQRLLAIGTPEEIALHSDWDSIGSDFTGLRGFGNVVWYPVSSVPVILGDGARLFDEMGAHKLRLSGARFRLHLAVEFPAAQAPTVVLINGHPVPLTTNPGNEEISGVSTAEFAQLTLGFEAPSLFVAIRKPAEAANTTLWARSDSDSPIYPWSQAIATVTPLLETWLGQSPRAQLTILDLPDPQDAPFESGALLATAIRPGNDDELQGILIHALTHAWIQSPQAWLSEGIAHFMGTLWLEKSSGRAKALESLEAQRAALALAEPATPGTSPGQPLAVASSPIYYRTKAAYVFWMLRDLAGDAALSAALRAYNSAADTTDISAFEKLVEQSAQRRDLTWFFADWVNSDKGLPDLAISNVVPQAAQAGTTLTGITIFNSGYAAAEVPVTLSTKDTSITQRIIVPARGSVTPRILILGTPTKVQVNDGTVPEIEASVHVTTIGDSTPEGSSSSSQQPVPQ